MNQEFQRELSGVNSRLKAGKLRVAVEQKGNKLLLRATLPPKPSSHRTKCYQQRIATGQDAHFYGLSQAEAMAKTLGAQLASQTFDWGLYGYGHSKGTCGFWIDKFEAQFWDERKQTPKTLATWKTYGPIFDKLPKNKPLTVEELVNAVRSVNPDTRSRQRYCTVAAKLARFAGLDADPILALKGNYGTKSVAARDLPTREQIAETYHSIDSPAWRYIYGLMACYGLRPHECFNVDHSEFPTVYTHGATKTGRRFVFAPLVEWLDWCCTPTLPNLKELQLPESDWSYSVLGTKVSKYFVKRKMPFNPYSLRHCYARHCFEMGFRADFAAKMMGHSLKIHTQVYRNFWSQDTYKAEYERVIALRATDSPDTH